MDTGNYNPLPAALWARLTASFPYKQGELRAYRVSPQERVDLAAYYKLRSHIVREKTKSLVFFRLPCQRCQSFSAVAR